MSSTQERGTVIKDRYRIEKFIGKGGQKTVYLVTDLMGESGNTRLVLKQMRGSTSKEDSVANIHLFEQEAIILKGLKHRSIPRIFDYFIDQGNFYMVEEYIEGDSLSNLIHRRTFSQKEALKFAIQMADCLDYLHRRKPPVIYRDLKPQNVKIDEKKVYFIDFSGVLLPGIGEEAEKTTVFSRGYTPPDVRRRKIVDFTFDTYSLGVVLYEMLTLYDVKSSDGRFPDIKTLRPDISPEIREIVNRAVFQGHYWQYQNMWEMKMELLDAYKSMKKLETLEEKKEKNPLLIVLVWLHKFRISLIQPLLALFSTLLLCMVITIPNVIALSRPGSNLGIFSNSTLLYLFALYILLAIIIWGRWFAGVPSLSRLYKRFYSPMSRLGRIRPISLLMVMNIVLLILLNTYLLILCLR